MSAERCAHEDELLDALSRGYVAADLEEHAATCAPCAELRLVAGALLDDRAQSMVEAPIPSAGSMWWRLRVRHRHEAEAAARRSLLIGQAVTLAIALVVVISLFGGSIAAEVRNLIATIHFSAPILVGLAMWILAAPIAGWLALRRE
jgi:hypothetical protein